MGAEKDADFEEFRFFWDRVEAEAEWRGRRGWLESVFERRSEVERGDDGGGFEGEGEDREGGRVVERRKVVDGVINEGTGSALSGGKVKGCV